MSQYLPGTRIYAIFGSDAKTKTLKVLGGGVYEGDEIPTTAVGGVAELVRASGRKNPKLVLDNGDVVWGCECWWGEAKPALAHVEGLSKEGWTIENVRIEDERRAYRESVSS